MEYRLSRTGVVCHDGENLDPTAFEDPHVKLSIPGAQGCWTRKLGTLLYATSFNKKDGAQHFVTLFKYHGKCKPRCVEVSDMLEWSAISEKDTLIHLFGLLLDFDGNRLSNRDRNTLLAGIRYNLPPVFIGSTKINGIERGFYVHNDQLTIFSKVGKDATVLIRTGYSLFSRNIKDSLK